MDRLRVFRGPARGLSCRRPGTSERHQLDLVRRVGGGRIRGPPLVHVPRQGTIEAARSRCRPDARNFSSLLDHRRHLLDHRVTRRREPPFAVRCRSLLPALLSVRLRCRGPAHAQGDQEDLPAQLVGRWRRRTRGGDPLRGICLPQHRAHGRRHCTQRGDEPCLPDR